MKQMIICNECDKELFETDKTGGAAGAEAQKLGFIFKMPFLFNCDNEYTCLYFCDHVCGKQFYNKHIKVTDEQKEHLKKLKESMSEMKQGLADGLTEIQNHFINK